MQEIIIAIFILGLGYLYSKNQNGFRQRLLVASIISFCWVSFSGIYHYQNGNLMIGGLNVFAFVAWTAGLIFLSEVYARMKGKDKYLKTVILYWVLLIGLEYIGYHWWQIQLNSNYPGLFGLDVLHVPFFAKVYYLSIGPIFLKVVERIRRG